MNLTARFLITYSMSDQNCSPPHEVSYVAPDFVALACKLESKPQGELVVLGVGMANHHRIANCGRWRCKLRRGRPKSHLIRLRGGHSVVPSYSCSAYPKVASKQKANPKKCVNLL